MPFQREWDDDLEQYVINRDQTGPPKPSSSTGTAAAALTDNDGNIVSAVLAKSPIVGIAPATPITVNLPNPSEPIVMANGRINHRWWRFFNELYLRTGGAVDAINTVPTTLLGAGSADSVALSGAAPTVQIDPGAEMGAGSIALSGAAPEATVV
jgi:hypothetical protein